MPSQIKFIFNEHEYAFASSHRMFLCRLPNRVSFEYDVIWIWCDYEYDVIWGDVECGDFKRREGDGLDLKALNPNCLRTVRSSIN